MDDLQALFQTHILEQSEFEQLLQMHFGYASAATSEEIQYGRQGEPAALIVSYRDSGPIDRIETGPGLATDDISQIIDKIGRWLLDDAEMAIGQSVMFSSCPLRGHVIYKDLFQLGPVPSDAPQPRFFGPGGHPLLLQYRFPSSQDSQIRFMRGGRVGRELELLCTALSTHINGAISNRANYHWSVVQSGDPTTFRSEFLQESYIWPGANGLANGFSDWASTPPIGRLPQEEYYKETSLSVGQDLQLSDSFEQLLDAYFGLSLETRERFLRSCYWHQFSRRASRTSDSAAFTALVSAIEALMPDSKPENFCTSCSRPLGAGPTKRFAEFVDRYAPSPGTTANQRRSLYSLRSALSHGGRLLHGDRFNWGAFTAAYLSDGDSQRDIWRCGRLVLVNWLTEHGRKALTQASGASSS